MQTPIIKRIKSGIQGFDSLVDGGIPRGTINLVSGKCGTGKNTFAIQFINEGASSGEPRIFVSLEKRPEEIIEKFKLLGFDPDTLISEKKLSIVRPELSKYDTLKKVIEDEIDKIGAKRLVISPFTLLVAYFDNVYDARKALDDFGRTMRSYDCTALIISDVPENHETFSATGFEEFVTSGVIVFDLLLKKDTNMFVRMVLIRKMAGISHSLKLVPIELTKKGIVAFPDAEVF